MKSAVPSPSKSSETPPIPSERPVTSCPAVPSPVSAVLSRPQVRLRKRLTRMVKASSTPSSALASSLKA